MTEISLGPIIIRLIAGRITTQGEYVRNSCRRVALQNGPHFLLTVTHTGEVGYGRDGCGLLDADYQIVGELTRASTGTISDGNEGGGQRLQFTDRLIKIFPCSRSAGREKLKGERWLGASENVTNVHEDGVIWNWD